MPKVTQTQVGSVFLKEVETRKWRASWTDPVTKKHVRRVLPAATFRQAEEQAKEINRQLAAGKGFGGRLKGSVGHGVADAVLEAIRHSDASDRTRQHYLILYNSFAEYLSQNAPGTRSWSDVTESILENYIEYCRRQGLAHDTIRLRLHVLRKTASYMSRTYPAAYRDVTANLRLRWHAPAKADLDAQESVLSAEQLRGLLAWLREADPQVYTLAVLQGLCGLRVREAGYIREQDFDSGAGTVRVAASDAHDPKTRHSYRTIPICSDTVLALSHWIGSLKVRHHDGYLFFPTRATSGRRSALSKEARAGAFTPDSLTAKWSQALRRARQAGLDLPEAFVPRKLRATFITLMREAGADFAVLQKYVGHAPDTIISRHYDAVGLDRLASIAVLAQALCDGAGQAQNRVADAE